MNLPDFVFIQNKELPAGGELLLYTKPPYDLFRVYKFEDSRGETNFINKNNLLNSCVQFDEYRIAICYIGTIQAFSEDIITEQGVPAQTLNLLPNLSKYYEKERIRGNESRLKKFLR